jgi:hypothetical protein
MGGWESFIPWEGFWSNFFAGLFTELVVVIVGVLFAHSIQVWWMGWRYGGWRVRLVWGEKQILERAISPRKARDILQELAELAKFLKGVISPYDTVHCDIIEDGPKRGLLVKDKEKKLFVIDLSNNPPPERLEEVRL